MLTLCAGAGKTTLAKALAERLGLPVYYEPVADNAYLEDFYRYVLWMGALLTHYGAETSPVTVSRCRCTSSIDGFSSTSRSSGAAKVAYRTAQ